MLPFLAGIMMAPFYLLFTLKISKLALKNNILRPSVARSRYTDKSVGINVVEDRGQTRIRIGGRRDPLRKYCPYKDIPK